MEYIQHALEGELKKRRAQKKDRRLEDGVPLYGEQTMLTVQNMSFSGRKLGDYPEYISNAIKVKKACDSQLHCRESGFRALHGNQCCLR